MLKPLVYHKPALPFQPELQKALAVVVDTLQGKLVGVDIVGEAASFEVPVGLAPPLSAPVVHQLAVCLAQGRLAKRRISYRTGRWDHSVCHIVNIASLISLYLPRIFAKFHQFPFESFVEFREHPKHEKSGFIM
jgi:hypothetical protein